MKEYIVRYRMYHYLQDEKEIRVVAETKEEALHEATYKQIPYIEGCLPCSIYIKTTGDEEK